MQSELVHFYGLGQVAEQLFLSLVAVWNLRPLCLRLVREDALLTFETYSAFLTPKQT
jgi:hypothetical protein